MIFLNQKNKRNIDTKPYLNVAEIRLKGVWEKDMNKIKKLFIGFPEVSNQDRMWFDAGFYEGALYVLDKLKKRTDKNEIGKESGETNQEDTIS